MSTHIAKLALIVLLAGTATSVLADNPPPAPAGSKIPVKTSDDLPRHTYTIEGKASEFLLSDKPFKDFVAKVKANVDADLAKYDITDRTTLQGYHTLRQQIAMFEGRLDDALACAATVKSLEGKESKKLMTGQVLAALVAASKGSSGDKARFEQIFKAKLNESVSILPYDIVREELVSARGRAQMITRELVLGQIAGGLDPVVEQQKGEVSGELVTTLVGVRVLLDHMLPIQPQVAEVYGKLIEANATERKDIWTPTLVTFTEADKLTPITVGIWDSGVDTAIFQTTKQLWTNPKETVDAKDNDGNGYIDDVHGIAYDLTIDPTSALLHPLSDLKHDSALMQKHMKGVGDVQSGVDSPEATEFRKYITTLKQNEVTPFLEDLGLFGNYSHGTHVAGIAVEGNPFARVLAARITFDYKQIPQHAPTEELAKKTAKAAHDTINYFKTNGVRVVNMSWGGSREDVEATLEKKGVGKNSEERAEIARKLFAIERDALDAAMRGAPEILFICAAGNSDNDNEFAELIPSGLKLPNMLTVGAVDSSGKPTSFTTFGKGVKLYANGFEVNSYIPGGQKLKFNGTSMAAPNAANLAVKILNVNPKLTPTQIMEIMANGADPLAGYEGRFMINPKKSIDMVRSGK